MREKSRKWYQRDAFSVGLLERIPEHKCTNPFTLFAARKIFINVEANYFVDVLLSEAEARFLFLGLKQFKNKKGGTMKASEMGFAFVDLQNLNPEECNNKKLQMSLYPLSFVQWSN